MSDKKWCGDMADIADQIESDSELYSPEAVDLARHAHKAVGELASKDEHIATLRAALVFDRKGEGNIFWEARAEVAQLKAEVASKEVKLGSMAAARNRDQADLISQTEVMRLQAEVLRLANVSRRKLEAESEHRREVIEDWQKVSGDDCPGELEYTLKTIKAELEAKGEELARSERIRQMKLNASDIRAARKQADNKRLFIENQHLKAENEKLKRRDKRVNHLVRPSRI